MSLLRKIIKKSAILFPHSVATKEYKKPFFRYGMMRPFCSVVQERIFFMSQNKNLRKIVTLSFLIALNIVLVRLLSFQTPVSRLDFGFLPISLAGAMFGPFWGGLTGGLADVAGMLFNSKGMAFFFGWTLNAILHGVFYGLFLYKKKKTLLRIALCMLIKGILVDLILGSIWGAIFRGGMHLIGAVAWERLVVFLVKAPVAIITDYLFFRGISAHVKELKEV